MKNILRFTLLVALTLFYVLPSHSQERSAYAVTDTSRQGTNWNYLRTVDLRTGQYSDTLLRLLNSNEIIPPHVFGCNGVAAIAHDKKNKRLYYTPMLIDRLSYVDLRTMRTFVVRNNFTGLMPKASDQSNIFTRMVIADDNNGYALTNDGRHLVRFTTGNNPVVTNLGSLVDAPGNNEMSVHNGCSSFGGDLIADDDGHLYLFTTRNHVFKIKIRTKVARYIGTVTGLPANFTTSGVAIDQAGNQVVIVSALDATDVYKLDIRNLVARGLNANRPRLASDLSNPQILRTNRDHDDDEDDDDDDDDDKSKGKIFFTNRENDSKIQLYPNPVTANEFKIQFSTIGTGNYAVEMINVKGQIVTSKIVNTGGKGSIVTITVPESTSRGIFIIRITDKDSKTVFSEKIILQ